MMDPLQAHRTGCCPTVSKTTNLIGGVAVALADLVCIGVTVEGMTDQGFHPPRFTQATYSIEPVAAPEPHASGSPRHHTNPGEPSFTGTQAGQSGVANPVNNQPSAAITGDAAEVQNPLQNHTTQTVQMAGPGQPHKLHFRNAEEARIAMQAHLVVRFEVDETYPQTDDDDQAYVKRIIAALTNTVGTNDYKDRSGKAPQAYSKFADNLYPSEQIELHAWEILVGSKVCLVEYGGC